MNESIMNLVHFLKTCSCHYDMNVTSVWCACDIIRYDRFQCCERIYMDTIQIGTTSTRMCGSSCFINDKAEDEVIKFWKCVDIIQLQAQGFTYHIAMF